MRAFNYFLFILFTAATGCKKAPDPPPKPRCKLPLASRQVTQAGGWFTCSGYADPYYNAIKAYRSYPHFGADKEIARQLKAKGFVEENGTLVFNDEWIVPRKDPMTSECHLICPPGLIPSPSSSTSCNAGVWTHTPGNMSCIPSPCGVPKAPENGEFNCYGNPSICYLTCDPGYATMTNMTISCQEAEGTWDVDPRTFQCEVAVALLTGGWRVDHFQFPKTCQTAEVFSPEDEACSTTALPLLPLGVSEHTSHLLNEEIFLCGGSDCEAPRSPPKKTCFKMMDNNTWTLHSELPDEGLRSHVGTIQQGQLQLISGGAFDKENVIVFKEQGWVFGRKPSLPTAVIHTSTPCIVATSPTTFIVAGSDNDQLSEKQYTSVFEYNSLTNEWFSLPRLPHGRSSPSCALVTTKSGPGIMVAGGSNPDKYDDEESTFKNVFLLDLGTKMWYLAGTLTMQKSGPNLNLVVLGERVFVLGGSINNEREYEDSSIQEYVVPCLSLKDCSPSQEGTWNVTDRITKRREDTSVLPVPASRFNCKG